MNRQRFIAELNKLLGFMSSWDREATIAHYNAVFDAAESEAEVLVTLGSPTKLAIATAKDYVPTPPPSGEKPLEKPAEMGENACAEPEKAGGEAGENGEKREENAPDPKAAAQSEATAEKPAKGRKPRRRIRPLALIGYVLAVLLIGLPVAVVLIAVGVPFLLAGLALGVGVALGVWQMIGALTMVADVLLLGGAGLALLGVGVFLLWFGLWLSMTLGSAWLGGVVFPVGAKLCVKKEVAE